MDDGNLVTQALRLYRTRRSVAPLRTVLTKNVPARAGLGGGSADAAAMLRALDTLAGAPIGDAELQAMALELGSDVPFFLIGGAAIGTGRGEELRPLPLRRTFGLVLVTPCQSVSTPEAFGLLEPSTFGRHLDVDALAAWLAGGANPLPPLRNAFETPARSLAPDIATTLDALRGTNCLAAHLSGSGSSCFALYETAGAALDAAAALPRAALRPRLVWSGPAGAP